MVFGHVVYCVVELKFTFLKERQGLDAEIDRYIDILPEVFERATKIKSDEEIVRYICERFILDISTLRKSKHPYHR